MIASSSMHVFEMMVTGTGAGDQNRNNPGVFNTAASIRLFSGQRPTPEQIASLTTLSTSESVYSMSKLPALLTSLGAAVTLTNTFTAANLPVGMAPNKITIGLSQITGLSSQSDLAPTWGLIYLFPKTSNAAPDSWVANALLYFTVGGVGSGADLIIPGGVIPRYNIWRPDDFEITLTGTVQ